RFRYGSSVISVGDFQGLGRRVEGRVPPCILHPCSNNHTFRKVEWGVREAQNRRPYSSAGNSNEHARAYPHGPGGVATPASGGGGRESHAPPWRGKPLQGGDGQRAFRRAQRGEAPPDGVRRPGRA